MKKISGIFAILFMLGLPVAIHAQDSTSTVKKTGKAIKKGAKKAGNKTAEVASKGKAAITDEKHKDKVIEMYDERFYRMWRLYLAYSIGGFRSGALSLSQWTFTRLPGLDWPLTREHLYHER